MLRVISAIFCSLVVSTHTAQSASVAESVNIHSLNDIKNSDPAKAINVLALGSNKDATDMVIFIKKGVKAHYHKHHTELVYVLAGTAAMQLGNETFNIAAGDYIRIEPNKVHAVTVTSTQPLKVLSIQTPEFDGSDRHFVE